MYIDPDQGGSVIPFVAIFIPIVGLFMLLQQIFFRMMRPY